MRLKRSQKYLLWAALIGLVVTLLLTPFIGPLSVIVGPLVGFGAYKGMLEQKAQERAVDGELLDK